MSKSTPGFPLACFCFCTETRLEPIVAGAPREAGPRAEPHWSAWAQGISRSAGPDQLDTYWLETIQMS